MYWVCGHSADNPTGTDWCRNYAGHTLHPRMPCTELFVYHMNTQQRNVDFQQTTSNKCWQQLATWGQGESAGLYRGQHVTEGRHGWPEVSPWLFFRGGRYEYISLSAPKTVCAWCTATSYKRWPCCAEHSGSKGVNLEKQSPILRCECRAYGMNGSGWVRLKRRPLGYQATSQK
jgi:hypothetical protein